MVRSISATDAARGFAELINRVRYQGDQFQIVRNGEAVALVSPTVPARAVTAKEVADLLANLPPLDAAFATELQALIGREG